jgi:hypothetical protein
MTTVNIDKRADAIATAITKESVMSLLRAGWKVVVWFALTARDIGWGFMQIITCPLTAETIKQKDFAYWKVLGCSIMLWIVMTCFLFGATLSFYGLVKFRTDRGDWSATKKYERAKAASIKYSNKFMCYNQDIQDQYTNDKDKERFEVQPIWYMSNFPDDIDPEAARVNYCRVWNEEGWSMAGPMGPRLFWASQFQRRVQVIYAHKRDWDTDLGRNYEGHEYRDKQTEKPSWTY